MVRFCTFVAFLFWCWIFVVESAGAQTPFERSALIWRGFQHRWSYNHRLSRLGDAVVANQCDASKCYSRLIHTASTGTGPDRCKFKSYYTLASANRVRFKTGSVSFIIEGKEGEQINLERPVSLPIDDSLYAKQENYTVVLNGYDLVSLQKADKVEKLSLSVSEGYFDPGSNTVKFDVAASLIMDCNSLECEMFNNTVKYRLTVNYLVLSGDSGYKAVKAGVQRRYFWDKRLELNVNPSSFVIKGDTNRKYVAATPAFKRITVALDKPHHFIEWNAALADIKYDTLTHRATVLFDFLFKQWAEGMQKKSDYPKYSKFSYKKAGLVDLGAEIVLIQFMDGCLKQEQTRGEVSVLGQNASAEAENTLYKTSASFMRICK